MGILDALHPDGRILVGYAFEADGGLRLGVNTRTTDGEFLHTHVDPAGVAQVVAEFAGTRGHVLARVPADVLCDCPGPRVNGRWPATLAEQDPVVTAALSYELEAAAGACQHEDTRVVATDSATGVTEVACEAPGCDWTEVG